MAELGLGLQALTLLGEVFEGVEEVGLGLLAMLMVLYFCQLPLEPLGCRICSAGSCGGILDEFRCDFAMQFQQ
jgi:hypothetical protein